MNQNDRHDRNARAAGDDARDEPADLDFLLIEALGGPQPPDLTDQILERLREYSATSPPVARPPVVQPAGRVEPHAATGRGVPRDHAAARRRWRRGTAIAAMTIAAAVWWVVSWGRLDLEPDRAAPDVRPPGPSSGQLAADDPRDGRGAQSVPSPRAERSGGPPRGIPLATAPPTDEPAEPPVTLQPQGAGSQRPSAPRATSLTLVSQQVSRGVTDYWQAVGVQPFPERSAEQAARHAEGVLGVTLPPEALSDPERLRVELMGESASRAVASRWLDQITGGGAGRLEADQRRALVDELAACFRGGQPFDRTLSEWLSGRSERSSSWYEAVSSGGRTVMVQRLASLTMNADLRCTRCHDAMIEGSGRQEDYWAFASLIRREIERDGGGRWKVGREDSAEPAFYSLPDGRQRLVEPSVPAAWLGSEAAPTSVADWADRLVGHPALAEGVVDSLWQLVYDRPLRGRVIDPVSAPHDETLQRLQQALVADARAARFDLGRTLALVLATPAFRREVPTALSPADGWAADDAARTQAEQAAGAFAASLPPRTELPRFARRRQLVMSAAGARLGQLSEDEQLLAQAAGGGDRAARSGGRVSAAAAAGFPTDADSLPIQWLGAIEGYQQRVEHLSYLAGHARVPEAVQQAADAMKKADIDEPLGLQRLWWLLAP